MLPRSNLARLCYHGPNASLNAASSFVQCYKSVPPPHPAPVISRGPTCFAMLKPKRLANQSIAYTKQGDRRSSVWWRNGRAGGRETSAVGNLLEGEDCGRTVISQETNDGIVAQSYQVQSVAEECRHPEKRVSIIHGSEKALPTRRVPVVPRYQRPKEKLQNI